MPVAAFKKLVAAFKKLVATCGDWRQYWTDVSLKCEISNESLKKYYYRLMKTNVNGYSVCASTQKSSRRLLLLFSRIIKMVPHSDSRPNPIK